MKDAKNIQNEAPTVISTDKARQGVTGHNVRYVLVFSMIGTVLALAATVIIVGAYSN